jgi:hypothetical protein
LPGRLLLALPGVVVMVSSVVCVFWANSPYSRPPPMYRIIGTYHVQRSELRVEAYYTRPA